jgi:hypothetical protein
MRLIPTKYQGRLHIIAPGTDDVQGKDRGSTSFWGGLMCQAVACGDFRFDLLRRVLGIFFV